MRFELSKNSTIYVDEFHKPDVSISDNYDAFTPNSAHSSQSSKFMHKHDSNYNASNFDSTVSRSSFKFKHKDSDFDVKIIPKYVFVNSNDSTFSNGNKEFREKDETDVMRWEELKSKLNKAVAAKDSQFQELLWNLLFEHREQFAVSDFELTQTNLIEHKINTENNEPFKAAWRPVLYKLQSQVQQFVDDFLNQGIIIPSSSPWNSAIVLVKKKDNSLRFCIDFRGLNALTKKDSYPLPNIDSVLTSLNGKSIFSSIDLASGYWQIKMHPDSREKTAFSAMGRHYEWLVMPFGLTTAPATFQRLMNEILGDLPFVIIYLDDILVCSKSISEHIEHLSIVFKRLKSAGLKMKPSKCSFGTPKSDISGSCPHS